jgi:hypothetical protein
MANDTFLDPDELHTLTGRAQKSRQIKALREMGVPFLVNAIGLPVVARVAVEGRANVAPEPKKAWAPKVMPRR